MAKLYKFENYNEYIKSQKRNETMMERTEKNWRGARLQDINNTKVLFPDAKSVVCVGCRHHSEIVDFESSGLSAEGFDLFASSEKVKVLDMHDMGDEYKENQFDVIYSSHSLEHCLDPKKVLTAFAKVSKIGCYVVLPQGKEADSHDSCCFDFMSNPSPTPDVIKKELSEFIDRDFEIVGLHRRGARGLEYIFGIKWN